MIFITAATMMDRRKKREEAMNFFTIVQYIGDGIDAFGVMIIILGCLGSTYVFFKGMITSSFEVAYVPYRQNVGRAILLGLEFLVAGDIVRTVAVSPSLMNIAVLGGIIIIRTILSMTMQLEVEGRWPWQQKVG